MEYQWEQMPANYFNGVTEVMVIFGPNLVTWISKAKMQDSAMEAWKEDKRIAERDGGGHEAFPPMSLSESIRYLSNNRPGLRIARTMDEKIVVKRETLAERTEEENEARHLTDAGGGAA